MSESWSSLKMMTIGLILVWLVVAALAALGFGWLCGISSDAAEVENSSIDEESAVRIM